MDNAWTKVLGFPGYRVYKHEIDEGHKHLTLWIRRKRGNRRMICSGCGGRGHKIHEVYEREVRDLPCFEFQATVVVELYRVDCPECGVKSEKVPQLPSKAPYSKRFEDAIGQAFESASARQWAPECKIVYDKFHVLQHANDAVDEVRKAEFFRQGQEKRQVIKGKKWLLLSRWKNLTGEQRGALNELFLLNRKVFKAYLLKESLEGLWEYQYPGAMLNYLEKWIDQLKWQKLAPFEKLADMLLQPVDGIADYCRTKGRFGVGVAVN